MHSLVDIVKMGQEEKIISMRKKPESHRNVNRHLFELSEEHKTWIRSKLKTNNTQISIYTDLYEQVKDDRTKPSKYVVEKRVREYLQELK